MTKRLIILLTILFLTSANTDCVRYLLKLSQMSQTNPEKFNAEITPYLVLSGKSIDDLGFSKSCEQDKRGYSFSTIEIKIHENNIEYSGYVGFCFTAICTIEELNQHADFLVKYIFEEFPADVHGKFVDSPMSLEFSVDALVMTVVFLVAVGIGMANPIIQWVKMCNSSEDEEYIIKSLYIDLENPNDQYDEEIIHEESTLLERLSLKYKWKQIWKSEETLKIYSFSLFRVIALPVILYGQIFWLTNKGAYNYYAFWEEIYDEFFVKFAVFSYYLPDIFFFISGFLFAKKLLQVEEGENQVAEVFKNFGLRLMRLYPLYIVVLLIYWCISPALHAGPVWYEYQQEAAVCNRSWWKVLLLIDNWFQVSCYPALWFVQVQVQYALLICLLFTMYYKCRTIFYYTIGVLYIASFALMFVLSAQLPASFSVALDSYTQIYFRSFYSHIWFSLTGVIMSILASKQSIRLKVQEKFIDNSILFYILHLIGVVFVMIVLLRPWVWFGTWSNKVELALCREGIMLAFLIFFLRGMFQRESHSSVIHKYGYYMYPVYLVIWMVISSNFWSGGSFPYSDGNTILNLSIANFLISGALGIFLGLVFDFRTFSIK